MIRPHLKQCTAVQIEIALDIFEHFKLDIAITGESGSGKSSLVNALLGLDHDEGGASTGVVETTMKPTMYQHPKHPHLRLWDLPGMGTPSFKAKSYVKKMNFDLYDMFILVNSERTKENNLNLVDEILKRNKCLYFVRAKVDNDLLSESRKNDFVETNVLERMRKDCLFHLQTKVPDPEVFLVSSYLAEKYDLQHLIKTIEGALPGLRKKVFGQFLETFSSMGNSLFKFIQPPALKRNKISQKDMLRIRAVFHYSNLSSRLTTHDILYSIDKHLDTTVPASFQ